MLEINLVCGISIRATATTQSAFHVDELPMAKDEREQHLMRRIEMK